MKLKCALLLTSATTLTAVLITLSSTAHTEELTICRWKFEQKHFNEAIKHCGNAADEGEAEAARKLAIIYENGYGVTKDYKRSIHWWTRAATIGDLSSQESLARRFELGGQGVIQDYSKAFYWYRLAAVKGSDSAQIELSRLYEHGMGVKEDGLRAYMWANIASREGWLTVRRDRLAAKLDTKSLNRAQEMSHKCINTNYKEC